MTTDITELTQESARESGSILIIVAARMARREFFTPLHALCESGKRVVSTRALCDAVERAEEHMVSQVSKIVDGHDRLTKKLKEAESRNAELVEALEKAQQSLELVDLQRDKIKRLESDLWDKEQLRKVHSEKSFELEGKVRELEARNQKDFVWRGEEIGRLNDEVDELKERLESRTVKLVDCDFGAVQHMSGGSTEYCHGFVDGTQNAIREITAAGIKWEAE